MEAELMTLVGCDLHTRKQQVALVNMDTGELWEQKLSHGGDAVERFYAALPPPVTVGIESPGDSLWFRALLQRLGHTLLVGEAAKIRAMVVRKTKTDRRDARHLRDLLLAVIDVKRVGELAITRATAASQSRNAVLRPRVDVELVSYDPFAGLTCRLTSPPHYRRAKRRASGVIDDVP